MPLTLCRLRHVLSVPSAFRAQAPLFPRTPNCQGELLRLVSTQRRHMASAMGTAAAAAVDHAERGEWELALTRFSEALSEEPANAELHEVLLRV